MTDVATEPVSEPGPVPARDPTPTVDTTPDAPPARNPIELVGGPPPGAATLEAVDACAWFGTKLVLEGVDLVMPAGEVTALIGPSGCGKSTFLRLLNRMHELIPGAALFFLVITIPCTRIVDYLIKRDQRKLQAQ